MNRNWIFTSLPSVLRAGLVALLLCLGGLAHAALNGWTGEDPSPANGNARTFVLTAKHHFVSTSDGNSHYAWGYAHTALPMQYPGPTLIVNQGELVKIVLNNTLPVPVSIILPGQHDVVADGGDPGLLTREARAVPLAEGGIAAGPTYTFVADRAGTFLYQSGTQADLQVEMGLVGALIVRPAGFAYGTGPARSNHPNRKAYLNDGTGYDREALFLLSEMDPDFHWTVYSQVFSGQQVVVDTTTIRASIWFINGRNAPDTLLEPFVDWLPTQPYNSLPRMHAGERLLMRVVNAGRDLHPFHHHGNHATAIARDGRVLSSVESDLMAPDVTSPDFTVRAVPGQTVDLIFEWTGKGIGWDVYGTTAINPHTCNPAPAGPDAGFDPISHEWCADHNKPIPVIIPGQLDVSYGEYYGGTPYLGMVGTLPQGHPGLNNAGSYFHMWHSHNEREITTDDIFPGGMMTMLVIEPNAVDLEGETGGGGGGGGGPGPRLSFGVPSFSVSNPTNTSFDGATLAFGDQTGTQNFAQFTITVTGAPATFNTLTVTNPGGGNRFTKSTDTCSRTTVPAGGNCTITIQYRASAATNITAFLGALTVPYGVGGPAGIALTGF